MSLLVPKHYKDTPVSSRFELQSDEFITREDVQRQLDELNQHIEARRAVDAAYHIPKPSGWRISVLLLTLPETSRGGVQIVDSAREARAITSPQGVVLQLGHTAYQDPERFALSGAIEPWHKPGDRITWKKYEPTVFQLANGQHIAFMQDTQPLALVDGGWDVRV